MKNKSYKIKNKVVIGVDEISFNDTVWKNFFKIYIKNGLKML